MKKNPTHEEITLLNQLLDSVMELHSFRYSTLAEAKHIIQVGSIYYCFDALSLCIYHCNLAPHLLNEFRKMMLNYYDTHFSDEDKKERTERESLFYFLTSPPYPFCDYHIEKTKRPDFVLSIKGTQRIGIEVVGLMPPFEHVYYSILKSNYGKGKTSSEIKTDALKTHGRKAECYDYLDFSGSPSVQISMIDTAKYRAFSAEQLYGKYLKYKKEKLDFDQFIVLGDARRVPSIAISSKEDIVDIVETLKIDSDMKGISFVILWFDDGTHELKISRIDY